MTLLHPSTYGFSRLYSRTLYTVSTQLASHARARSRRDRVRRQRRAGAARRPAAAGVWRAARAPRPDRPRSRLLTNQNRYRTGEHCV